MTAGLCLEGVYSRKKVNVLTLIMRWPEVWGGGVSWSYWILGEGLCGAYRTDFLSPGEKKRGT